MRKGEEITREMVENRGTERQLGELTSFLGELTLHLGSISRFFQSKLGERAEAPVLSLRGRAIQGEIEKSLLAIGRGVFTNSNADPEPIKVTGKIKNLFSRVKMLQEIMDEIDGKTPVEKALPEASEEAPAQPEEKTPDKAEAKPPVKTEEKAPDKTEEKPPVKAEEKTPDKAEEKAPANDGESDPVEAKDEEPGGGSPDRGEATDPTQSPGGDDTEKKVVQEHSN